jgi:hypothetical protein
MKIQQKKKKAGNISLNWVIWGEFKLSNAEFTHPFWVPNVMVDHVVQENFWIFLHKKQLSVFYRFIPK